MNFLSHSILNSSCKGILIRMYLYFSLVPCLTEGKYVCLTHDEAKQYQHVGVWSRESSPARGMAQDLKPQTPGKLSS